VQALLEVVQSGGKNLEVAVMRKGSGLQMLEVRFIYIYIIYCSRRNEE
jgi:20S proteasome subunit alpha 4